MRAPERRRLGQIVRTWAFAHVDFNILKAALHKAIAAHDPEVYNRVLREQWQKYLERDLELAAVPARVLH